MTAPAPTSPESSLNKALALLQEGKCGPASALFSEYLRENPDSADAYLGRGRCAAAANEHLQAVEDFSAALDLEPDSADALWSRAVSLCAVGKNDAALADLDKSLKIRPDFADAYCARAAERIRLGQIESALQDCTEAMRLNSAFAEAYYQRHLANARLRREELALSDYEEAWRLGCRKEKVVDTTRVASSPQAVLAVPSLSPQEAEPETEPTTAHVLFMDVVKSGQLTANQQERTNARLTEVVMNTQAFREARPRDEVIALPTGDGMALVFKKKFEAPMRCSIEIARVLRTDPFCRLRMGIHTGVVFLHRDINGNQNVTGPGINLAERVMSCGGDGHILVSSSAAELLRPLSAWRGKLQPLGEYLAKSDWVTVWNFVDGAIGNSAAPEMQSRKPTGFVESA